jgi:hypothetical protein
MNNKNRNQVEDMLETMVVGRLHRSSGVDAEDLQKVKRRLKKPLSVFTFDACS